MAIVLGMSLGTIGRHQCLPWPAINTDEHNLLCANDRRIEALCVDFVPIIQSSLDSQPSITEDAS